MRPLLLVFVLVLAGCVSGVSPPPGEASEQAAAVAAASGYVGQVLAGEKSVLLDYSKADFDKALASDQLVVLYFYANWCPICREEVPRMYEAFGELTADRVVGFRVNYNDDETDDDERALAREHGVAYQHTKVFVKNGMRVLKSPETWDKQRYLSEIGDALG